MEEEGGWTGGFAKTQAGLGFRWYLGAFPHFRGGLTERRLSRRHLNRPERGPGFNLCIPPGAMAYGTHSERPEWSWIVATTVFGIAFAGSLRRRRSFFTRRSCAGGKGFGRGDGEAEAGGGAASEGRTVEYKRYSDLGEKARPPASVYNLMSEDMRCAQARDQRGRHRSDSIDHRSDGGDSFGGRGGGPDAALQDR